MVAILNYLFIINGIDVTRYVTAGTKIELERENVSGNTAEIILDKRVDSILAVENGQVVAVSRGVTTATESYKFRGNIKQKRTVEDRYVLTCKDPLQKLKYLLLTKSYDKNIDDEAGEISAIFKDIGERGGFTVSTEDSGTGLSDITLKKYISKKQGRLERMRVLGKILDWVFYYDYDNEYIRFEPKGTTTYPNTFEVGVNVFNIPKFNEDIEPMRNEITVDGVFQLDTRKETETGDNSTTEFSFTFSPESTDLTVDGVLQKKGVVDSSESFDYTVDKENLTYTFVTAPTVGQAIVMSYTTKIPAPVIGDSPTSKSRYGLTQEASYKFDDVVTVADAEVRVDQLLELLQFAEYTTTLLSDEYTVKPGDKITYKNQNDNTYDDEYIVTKVMINYPDPYDSVEIGTPKVDINFLFSSIEERLRALEFFDTGLVEILLHIKKLTRDFFFERRYSKVIHKDRSGDTDGVKIFGHPTFGVFGFSKFGDSNTTETDIRVTQGKNIYKEFFYDDDFIDTGASTVTLNTADGQVEF